MLFCTACNRQYKNWDTCQYLYRTQRTVQKSGHVSIFVPHATDGTKIGTRVKFVPPTYTSTETSAESSTSQHLGNMPPKASKKAKHDKQPKRGLDGIGSVPAKATTRANPIRKPKMSSVRLCEHNKRKSRCVTCGGGSICEHQKQRSLCVTCGGSAICEHKTERSQCIPCGGSGICEHRMKRSQCVICDGSSICKHKKRRILCRPCMSVYVPRKAQQLLDSNTWARCDVVMYAAEVAKPAAPVVFYEN